MTITKIAKLYQGQETVIVGRVKVTPHFKRQTAEPWFHLKVADNTGFATAMVWQEDELFSVVSELQNDDVIEALVICTDVGDFTNFTLKTFKKRQISFNGRVNIDALKNELRSIIAEMKDPALKRLVCSVMGREEIKDAYFRAPATTENGYRFEGGVVAEVVRSIRLMKAVASVYNDWEHNIEVKSHLHEELLVVATILQPVGIVRSFFIHGNRVEKTLEGELLEEDGRLSLKILHEELSKLKAIPPKKGTKPNILSPEQEMMLEHLLGASVSRTREADVFQSLYKLDLRMGHYEELDRDANVSADVVKLFSRTVYLGGYES